MVAEFGITLDEVNWLGNIVAIVYLPVAILIPSVCARWGLRRCVRLRDPHSLAQTKLIPK